MRGAVVWLLLVWALVATWFAVRGTDAPPPPPPVPPDRTITEIEWLRSRITELEGRENARTADPTRAAPKPGDPPGTPAPKTFGEAADRLLAEYRRLRDAEEGNDRRTEILKQLARLAERDRSIHLAWPALLRESRDEEEAEDITWVSEDSTHPDPGGPIDVPFRAALETVMAGDPKPYRRAYAVEMLMGRVEAQPGDFRAALDAARVEADGDARLIMLHAMAGGLPRSEVDPADAAGYVEMIRRELRSGELSLAPTLASWSEDRMDFDRILTRLEQSSDTSLMWALRGGRALTKGREAECRAALAAIAGNVGANHTARVTAVTILDSLRPWDPATEEAVRSFREKGR